ncbi:MAG: SDR family oxidoreductase [Syntrophothermus sp.]
MDNKDVTIVTGASKGIGRAIALRFAKEGHNVVPFGRNLDDLRNVLSELKELGSDSTFYAGDVGDTHFVNHAVKDILNKYGKVNHLINNAGFGILKNFVDSSIDEFKSQIDTNLFGVYNFTKAVVDNMIKRKSGSIIMISSLAGKNNFVGGTMYSSSKHALMGFSKSLFLELREYNIRVATVCPGSVDTDFNPNRKQREDNEMDKILHADDVAEVVYSIIKMPIRALISDIDIRPTNPK